MQAMSDALATPVSAAAAPSESLWKRRVVNPLLALARQGITPEKLALSVSLGCVIGVFPVVGTTTISCIGVAAVLRLNQVAMQVGNWIAYPFLLLLVIPFVRLGEWIMGAHRFPLDIKDLRLVAEQGASVFLVQFGDAIAHGILGWIAVAPLATAIIFFSLLPLFRKSPPGGAAKPAA